MKLLIDPAMPNHPKVRRLAAALEVNAREARGVILALWAWTMTYHENGSLAGVSASEIATAADWPPEKDPERFLQVLLDVRLLDRTPEMAVHDWLEEQGALLTRREKERRKKARQRARRRGVSVPSGRVHAVPPSEDNSPMKISPGTGGTCPPGTEGGTSPSSDGQGKEGKGKEGKGRAGNGSTAHHVPDELRNLSLYADDRKLCDAWHILRPEWSMAFPGVDLMAEIRKAHSWEVSNPAKRKVDRRRFLHSWLARAQDQHGGRNGRGDGTPQSGYGTGTGARSPARISTEPLSLSVGDGINRFIQRPAEGRGGPGEGGNGEPRP